MKTATNTRVSYNGKMKVEGQFITGEKSKEIVQVRGMSFFWSNTGWGQEKWYTKETVNKMIDEWKCEIVRAAMGVNEIGGYQDEPEINYNRVKTIVDTAIEKDVYVIIDWHSHHAEDQVEDAKKFFDRVAAEYGKQENVIFEIYNEPLNTVSWKEVKKYAEEIIPVIRKHSDNIIIVGSPTWSQDVDIAAKNPIESSDNIAYTIHFYAGTHEDELRKKGDKAIEAGLALFATEWGTVEADGDGDAYIDSTEKWMEWMDQHKISWCNWAISDKKEGASIWDANGELTKSGGYVKKKLLDYSKK